MNIVELRAERFKRLSAVEIRPNPQDSVVFVEGKNGQGKSSVLDSIWLALKGAKAQKESGTIKPVKEGERDAVVQLDLGDILVTRKWKDNGRSELFVTSKEGTAFSSPQALLDSLTGPVMFDPLSFSRLDAKEQRRQLLDIIELEEDPDKLDAKRKALYDERTEVNREVRNLKAALSAMPSVPEGTPDREISAVELMDDYNRACDKERIICEKENELDAMRAEVKDVKAKLEAMKKRLELLIEEGKKLAAEVEADKADRPDLDAIRSRIVVAEETNRAVRAKLEQKKQETLIQKAECEADRLTSCISELDRRKDEIFAKAKFPLKGLSLSEEGILYGGIPFSQCSSAEQLRVCVAIGAALNPKIRIMRIADGSLLDSDSMAYIEELARQNDLQIWVERVTDGEGVGFVIEDGTVKL